MTDYTESGVVLHSMKYGENQLIIHLLTSQHGRRSYITKFSRSQHRSLFQPLFLIDFEATSTKTELHKLRQTSLNHPYAELPFDVVKSSIGLFVAEILYRLIRDESTDARLYDFVRESLIMFDMMRDGAANFHLHFLVRMTHYLGYAPNDNFRTGYWLDMKSGEYTAYEPQHGSKFAPHTAQLFAQLWNCPLSALGQVKLNREQRSEFLDSLIDYYGYHTDLVYNLQSISMFHELF